MFCWGIVNMCMGFVNSYAALVALRFLLGTFEAGVMPGIIYLTSMYYKRHEFQKRMSFFFCSTLVGGAFGGVSPTSLPIFVLPPHPLQTSFLDHRCSNMSTASSPPHLPHVICSSLVYLDCATRLFDTEN